MGYDELAKLVNHSFSVNGDVRMTLKEVRKVEPNLTFSEVWEMIGFKDYFDWMETDED
jgi:hypothetical protein